MLWTTGERIEEYVRGVVMIVMIKGCRDGDRDDNRDVVVVVLRTIVIWTSLWVWLRYITPRVLGCTASEGIVVVTHHTGGKQCVVVMGLSNELFIRTGKNRRVQDHEVHTEIEQRRCGEIRETCVEEGNNC